MSDSESFISSVATPSESTLTKELRNVVRQVFTTNRLENLTVKRVRKATEEKLSLTEGFFKQHQKWSAKSKQIIEEEAEAQHQLIDAAQAATPSPTANKSDGRQKQVSNTKAGPVTTKKGTKRSSPEDDLQRHKRQKQDESSLSEFSELSTAKPTKRTRKQANSSGNRRSYESAIGPASDRSQGSEVADSDDRTDGAGKTDPQEARQNEEGVGSESEMSVLIDEEPPPQRKTKKSSSGPISNKVGKAKSEGSSKPKNDLNSDPQQAEIKRLQSWLLKCGIRKLWHKELATYDTPKAKIIHLKDMLKDAGMDGRYSVEKARQIKESREFKADLEAVQEGAKKWGQSGHSEESSGSEKKPKRRLARGLKELDFLADDDDGEETD